jgi:hypothetical protein
MLALVHSGYIGIQEARIVHAKQEIFPVGGGLGRSLRQMQS